MAVRIKVPSDLEIAQAAELRPIVEIAREIGLSEDDLELYGKYKAKVHLDVRERLVDQPKGKYIDVTAITPTPLGEGKTTLTIGLAQALGHLGKRAFATIRQPSLGPVFGIKGGAAGGGYAQVVPMEDFNLHLTGDFHAVTAAHNLLAAALDGHIFHGNQLNIDFNSITWPRVLDVNDRVLRDVVVGLGGRENGYPRETRFDITSASEVMAILALTTDLLDLRERLGRIVVGTTRDERAISAADLRAAGAMTVLLKDTLMPNLLQTLEHTPVFVHTGPFANIAHGNSSVIADQIALKLADYVITESGFGADMGMEKFMNIKCRTSGLVPDAVVLVATIRALKMHGGLGKVVAGRPLPEELLREDLGALERGCANLVKQIENARRFGVPVVVAINRFPADTDWEISRIELQAVNAGAEGAFVTEVWVQGGPGGTELARAVIRAAEKPKRFRFLYPLDAPIHQKIETIASQIYGAEGVDYLPAAQRKLKLYTDLGFADLPICMAKTHLSLTDDPNQKGAPKGWRLTVRDIRLSAGAGFLYPLCGEMMTMPGLGSSPALQRIDIDERGCTIGLF